MEDVDTTLSECSSSKTRTIKTYSLDDFFFFKEKE